MEKIPGALAALLAQSVRGLTTRPLTAPTTELGELISLLVRAFLEHVQDYASRGRDWRYGTRREVSSLIGGRLSVTDTLTLRARGLRHLVAFDRPYIDRATPTNRVVLAALREIEVLATLVRIPSDDLAAARALGALFADCLDAEILLGSRDMLLAQVTSALDAAGDEPVREMLSLAGALVAHASLEPEQPMIGRAPLAWFVNLETLFEAAVRRRLKALTPPAIPVTTGRTAGAAVFPDAGYLQADPDLLVGLAAVGDVKYKQWTGAADASDLYQLLTHAAAFGSPLTFLVYPSDQYESVSLAAVSRAPKPGCSPSTCATWILACGRHVEPWECPCDD